MRSPDWGAFARALSLWHMYNIEPGRRTADVDISIQLKAWEEFDALSEELKRNDFHNPNVYHPKKFCDKTTDQLLDILTDNAFN